MKELVHRVVGGTATCVFLELQTYAHLPEGARPSIARVAEALGLSRSTVQRAVATLVSHGYLEVEHRYQGKQQLPSLYHFPSQGEPRVISDPPPRSSVTYEPNITTTHIRSVSSSLSVVGLSGGNPQPKTPRGMASLATKTARAVEIADTLQRARTSRGQKPPSATARANWERSAYLLLTEDARSSEEVLRVLAHVLQDPYWAPKVQSIFYFRQRYAQFLGQVEENKPRSTPRQDESGFFDLSRLLAMAS